MIWGSQLFGTARYISDTLKETVPLITTFTHPVPCVSDNVSSGYPSAGQRSLYDDRTLYNYFVHLERLRGTNPQLFTQQMTSYRCVPGLTELAR